MIHLPDLSFVSAFMAGLLSSGHCLTMCGALALASHTLGPRNESTSKRQIRTTTYHLGRLLSYTLIGTLAGGTGGLILSQTCSDETLAHWPRITANLALLIIAVSALIGWNGMEKLARPFLPLWRKLMPTVQRLRNSRQLSAHFTLGMLWGWIPCGLVYTVAMTAAISGSALTGASLLLGFGLGTLPALLGGSTLIGLTSINTTTLLHGRHVIAMSIVTLSLYQLANITSTFI